MSLNSLVIQVASAQNAPGENMNVAQFKEYLQSTKPLWFFSFDTPGNEKQFTRVTAGRLGNTENYKVTLVPIYREPGGPAPRVTSYGLSRSEILGKLSMLMRGGKRKGRKTRKSRKTRKTRKSRK
jgi:hypothetical protein